MQEDVEVARKLLTYVLDDSDDRGDLEDAEEERDPNQASDEEGGSPRAPLYVACAWLRHSSDTSQAVHFCRLGSSGTGQQTQPVLLDLSL